MTELNHNKSFQATSASARHLNSALDENRMFRSTISARTSSNTWLGLVGSIGLLVFSTAYSFKSNDEKSLTLLVLSMSLAITIFLITSIIKNKEWELVVNQEQFRWGNVKKKGKQEVVSVESVQSLRFTDYDNNSPYEIVTKAGVEHGIPAFLLLEGTIEDDLIGYLRKNHPKIEIDLKKRRSNQSVDTTPVSAPH